MKKVAKKKVEVKYITTPMFEDAMRSIAKSFDDQDKRFDNIDKSLALLIKMGFESQEEGRQHRMAMAGLNNNDINTERDIKNLKIRVMKLEAKIK